MAATKIEKFDQQQINILSKELTILTGTHFPHEKHKKCEDALQLLAESYENLIQAMEIGNIKKESTLNLITNVKNQLAAVQEAYEQTPGNTRGEIPFIPGYIKTINSTITSLQNTIEKLEAAPKNKSSFANFFTRINLSPSDAKKEKEKQKNKPKEKAPELSSQPSKVAAVTATQRTSVNNEAKAEDPPRTRGPSR